MSSPLTAVGDTMVKAQENNIEEVDIEFKMSEEENQRMKLICGLEDTEGDEEFPKWYRELFAKHQDEKEKSQVIATANKKCDIFDDAEVPI